VHEAARDLTERREQEAPIVEREYKQTTGADRGKRSPLNQTLSAKRAAADLASARRAEREAEDIHASQRLREQIDLDRSAEQAAKADADLQPDLQPQPEQVQQPAEAQPQATPGVDPEVAKALQNPKVVAAINEQIASSEQARQQYSAAVEQMGHATVANILASFPEMKGINAQNFQQAIQAINAVDPARAQAIVSHVRAASQQLQAIQQQQTAQRQQAAQQQQTWMNQQDDEFEKWSQTQPANEVKAVRGAVIDTLTREYGIDRAELAQLWNSQPLMRSLPVQRLLYDITRFHLARAGIQKAATVHRPVQRPGTAETGHADYSELTARMKDFAADATPRKAAAALMARRRAALR
jgi:hypothetical protein